VGEFHKEILSLTFYDFNPHSAGQASLVTIDGAKPQNFALAEVDECWGFL